MTTAENKHSLTTRWSEIVRASGDDPRSRAALDALLRRYLPLLRIHLRRRSGLSETTIDDLLQDFVASKILEQGLLAQADPIKGKFRTLLLTALDRFAIDRLRRSGAAKRDESKNRALDASIADPASPVDAGAFSVDFARAVINQTLADTEAYCRSRGLESAWEVFRLQVVAPVLTDAPRAAYGEIVGALGFASPAQAANALNTAKRIFRRTLSQTLLDFGVDPEELDSEIRDLGVDLRAAES